MNRVNSTKSDWEQEVVHEAIEYWINFIYLAFFFGMFTWYRRFILAEYQISYAHYGVSLIEAAVLAKVITFLFQKEGSSCLIRAGEDS